MRRPWNIINLPIYSLQTVDKDGKLNMNICTYVSVVSMKPKIYSVAVYYGTKKLTDPLLNPIRNFLPNLSGIDISPVVLILILYFIRNLLFEYFYMTIAL